MTTTLFDAGLQPERTHLAWRRTALSVSVGSIVSLRVLPATFHDPLWYLPGIAGVAFSAWLWAVAALRYRRFASRHAAGAEARGEGGAALLCLTVFTVVVGLLGVATVVMRGDLA